MLTASRNTGASTTSNLNIVDEAGKGRNTADDEGRDCTPVACEFGRIAIDAVEVVHIGDGHVTSSNDVVAIQVSGLAMVCFDKVFIDLLAD